MPRPKNNSLKHNLKTHRARYALGRLAMALLRVLQAVAYLCIGVGWLTVWLTLLPLRIIRYMWRFGWGRRWLLGMALALSICLAWLGVKMYLAERAGRLDAERQALILSQELMGAKEANYAIYAKMEQQQKGIGKQISPESKNYIVSLVKQIFGSQSETALRVFKCESGLSNFNYGINKDGSLDGGVAQINNKWHKARFEKMYGVPYEIGIYNPELNIKYAKYLYDHSGWGPWVCARITGALASK